MVHNGLSMRTILFTLALTTYLQIPLLAQGGFAGPGRYEITNVKSGMSMSVGQDGASVVQFAPGGSTGWTVEPAGSGFYYLRDANGNALEAYDTRNSTPLRVARFNGSPNQQWRLEQGKDGNALIVSRLGKTIDVPDGSNRQGLQLQIYDSNGDSNQRFMFRQVQAAGAQSRFGRFSSPGAAPYPAAAPYSSGSASQVIRCSSDDGRRNYCAADTNNGVRLTRQISGSPCQEGQTWGYDRRGIWVDRGCRAEFEIGGNNRPERHEYRQQSRFGAPHTVRCSSDDGRRNYCAADTTGGVRMLRQVSGSACREGQTWGYDRKGIWVDRGCRAEFEIGNRR